MLPDQAIIEFQSLYQQQVGIPISFSEAKKEAENFIKLFELVTKNENEYEKNDKFYSDQE